MSFGYVLFDSVNSYTDLGLYLSERPDLGSPLPKTNMVEIPGADGALDMTEANAGEVKFRNREMTFVFSAMADVSAQAGLKTLVYNSLLGIKFEKIILSEDSGWAYTGRVTKVDFQDQKSWKLKCRVTVDAEPYAVKQSQTEYDPNTSTLQYTGMDVPIGENVSSYYDKNTRFNFGSYNIPTGDFRYYNTITVKWPTSTSVQTTRSITLYDNEGNTSSFSLSNVQISSGEAIIPMSSFGYHMNLQKIYKVIVTGISRCSLYATIICAKVQIRNERKPVVPEFGLVFSGNPTFRVYINDGDNARDFPNGWTTDSTIKLKRGYNNIYIQYMGPDVTLSRFRVRYWEAKL